MSNIVDFRTTWISPCQSAIRLQKQSDIIASDQSALAQSISNFSAIREIRFAPQHTPKS